MEKSKRLRWKYLRHGLRRKGTKPTNNIVSPKSSCCYATCALWR